MGNPVDTFDSSFVIVILGILLPSLAVCLTACYKSKCNKFTLCNGYLLNIQRDVQAEVELEEVQVRERAASGSIV